PIEDLVAYNLYLKGRYFCNKSTSEDLNKAIEYFEQAIERTSDFTQAYAGLSVAYTLLCIYDYLHSEDGFPKAKEAALKAVEIDETCAGAHISLGSVKLYYDWDWEGAEKEYMRASELNPNHERIHLRYAGYFATIGRLDEAIMESRKALELDPLSIIVNSGLGMYLLRANQLKQAKEQVQKTLELVPNHPVSLFVLGQVYVLETRYEKGIAEIQKAFKLSGKNAMTLTALGWAYAVSGQKKEARKVLVELKKKSEQEYVRPFSFAKIHSALGEINQAFQWLDKAYEEHDISLIHIMTDETIENLRSDPRYNELLKKMNLNK
ncbi:MAG: tetratricopeptide repeat protein, partial [Candidatus Heimdallarchaeota archaeon]|nr:tetratricopeptide repeat protein [Candidatus Heimdallarchaeota archaeon]